MPGKPVHFHGEGAIKMAKNMAVGTIKEPFTAQIFKHIKPEGEVSIEKETWKLVNKKMVSAVHGVFQFKNDKFKISAMLPYYDHCGKYYTVRKLRKLTNNSYIRSTWTRAVIWPASSLQVTQWFLTI